MSKSQIIFYDPNILCKSHLHMNQKLMRICLQQQCYQIPTLVCVDCVQIIHQGHDQIVTVEDFVKETNEKYQQIQETSFKMEGQIQLFQNKAQQMKKYINGELEKIKNNCLQHLDMLKTISHNLIDSLDKQTRNLASKKNEVIMNQVKTLRPHRMGDLNQEQLKSIIELFWHSNHNAELSDACDLMSKILQPIQSQIKRTMVELTQQLNNVFLNYRDELETKIKEQCSDFFEELNNALNSMKQQKSENESTNDSKEFEIKNLLSEKDQVKKQMDQHLVAKNCTHKGCHTVTELKAFYGYYYNISNYAQYPELDLSCCAKAKKLNEKMHYISQRLYELGYRDNQERDYIQSYFIK